MIDLKKISTEGRNKNTFNLDSMSSLEIVTIMNKEDSNVIKAIKKELPSIAKMVDLAYKTLFNEGRVIYMGAGTSGRLSVVDASECPPTFGVNFNTFVALMAGGKDAFIKAIEGAEDSKELAIKDLKGIKLTKRDLVIGVAASGRTPYVIGGLEYAKKMGCKTGSIACSKNAEISKFASVKIEVTPGPEVLTGSTRLKAGTAQKLVLNMISTGSMVKMGKCYQNLMVDVVPTNKKLIVRAQNIVMQATDCTREVAIKKLEECDYKAKIAITMILCNCSKKEAINKLNKNKGHIKACLKRSK